MKTHKKTGLFFGSFNPVHTGHMIIANYMVEFTDLREIWFVISPHNPLKQKSSLLADHHRYYMIQMAVEDDKRFRASNVEFDLPQPSYTIDTLTYLNEKFPGREFCLITGSDIFSSFHKWKNYKILLDRYCFYVYPRPGSDPGPYQGHPNLKPVNAPMVEISSSFIRKSILDKKEIRYFLPAKVYEHILEMHFYE
ncbi:MAG: nicotinate-nucleotide adenylyltransferase [Bacteroidales bacterium]|nr:nicotinate-nucleotide adenylyltransferase [Bacteroidales bacterium]MCF8344481.1 nicotinate-nucleotide adenylyltransferase [Bacteroidales bacterium]MCF8352075.1 nicotinate-nucleotide adenylyltransferase [Bacteroidales bacterium]MCF8377347.1 nicotinate-nucleotide adenylyltransferase [Bacteroidales bacterium]MCF8401907.1 nicotinate-nucleotide adenylyltransferase [Bacteroidales bacterium]